MKNKFLILLRVTISLIFIGLLVWIFRKDIPDIAGALKRVNPPYFLTAFFFNIMSLVVVSQRLRMILRVQELRISLGESVYLNFIGNFFNNFLPTAIGGDLARGNSSRFRPSSSTGSSVFSRSACWLSSGSSS